MADVEDIQSCGNIVWYWIKFEPQTYHFVNVLTVDNFSSDT
ncbi:hypothetical protein XBFFR1_1020006 [Xenorhabdus bovienii str. feltiae France]|nr:hypothetical protein XBFFR1_1020006 [Xenorhabdus bovienii str. feltiae France]